MIGRRKSELLRKDMKFWFCYQLIHNKLLLQWKGPFEILERVRGDDYRIQLVGRTKTFHANMLKKYWSREHEDRVHVSHAMIFEPEEGDEDELKGKRKEVYLYSAFIVATTLKALRRGSHSFTCK